MQPAALQHVAELNIGVLRHPVEDPRVSGFVDALETVNALAERAPGFVWRCVDEPGAIEDEGVVLFDGHPNAVATLSVWDSAEALEAFVHRTLHGAFLRRRAEWFVPQAAKTYVLWPVAAGHRPGFAEGLARLDRLNAAGASPEAHDFAWLRAQRAAQPAGV